MSKTAKLTRIIAILLCCALALGLAACGGAPASGSASAGASAGPLGTTGRYVETDITPPDCEEVLVPFITEDGSLVCYSQDLTTLYTSTDGGQNWQQDEGPAARLPLGDGMVGQVARLHDGSLLVQLCDAQGNHRQLVRLPADSGEAEPFAVPALDEAVNSAAAKGHELYLSQLKALSADRLFLGFASGNFGRPASEAPQDEPGEDDGAAASLPTASSAPDESQPAAPDASTGGDEPEDGGLFDSFSTGPQTNFAGLIDLASGQVVAEFPDWYGVQVAASDDTLYLLDYDGLASAYSLADGKATPEADTQLTQDNAGDDFSFSLNMSLCSGPNGLYLLNGRGILQQKGAGASTLVEGGSFSFADPNYMPSDLLALADGSLVVHLLGQTGSRLYRYHWDETATVDPARTLKVWSLRENALLRAAISALRRAAPDVEVEVEIALGGGEGMTAEDALKTLNTRMLNGDGPDVLMLDGAPAESYAARGMLANMDGLVDTSGMFKNLLAPFAGQNGTFYLPTNIKIPLLLGSGDALAAADGLEALAGQIQAGPPLPQVGDNDDVFASLPPEQRPVLALNDLSELFALLWDAGASSVLAGGGLNTEALSQLLATMGDISQQYDLANGGTAGAAMLMMSAGNSAASATGSALAYASQRAVLGAYTADDIQMLQFMMDPPGSEMKAFPGLSHGSFVPVGLVGMAAGSQKAELAVQFINTLLSAEVQGMRTGAGLPVTEQGIQKQISEIDAMMQEHENERFEFDYAPLYALPKTPQMADAVVREAVWQTAQRLCQGQVDTEGAVTEIEQNLKNYLAERQ